MKALSTLLLKKNVFRLNRHRHKPVDVSWVTFESIKRKNGKFFDEIETL
jgi:hypothetical protein